MNGDGCVLCERARLARAGGYPLAVMELDETVVVLHEHQAYAGWCVLLLKEHAEHLADLPIARQERVFGEVARVAAAVRAAFSPRRINYECLGNVAGHVHWHVIPRYAEPVDPEPRATVWVRPKAELECGVEAGRARELISRIGAELGRMPLR